MFQSNVSKKSVAMVQQDQIWRFNGQYWNTREKEGSFNKFFENNEKVESNQPNQKCPPKLW